MKQTVNEFMFMEAFKDMNRRDNFTPEALRLIFQHFEELEEDTEQEMELDVIAICCEISQEPLEDVLSNYSLESLEELAENTMVIGNEQLSDGTVIYYNF